MVIRRARDEDTGGICEIHRTAVQQLARDHYSDPEIEAWVAGLTPQSYKNVVHSRECFVAERGGVILGFGHLGANCDRIEAVFVAPDCIRQGVGAALLSHLESVARERSVRCLELSASLNSVAFYKRAGYQEQERGRQRLLSGAEIACVKMRKVLEG